jgi:PKD repeat protein
MVYDSQDRYVLLFGGQADFGGPLIWLNDTWTFSGGAWTNVTNPAHSPSGRLGFGLADDPADHEVVLFGGSSYQTSYLNDTWTYSGGVWTNISPVHSPPRMFWGSMAYDNQTSSVLLFGGNTGGGTEYTNQTWEFHAGAWTNITTVVRPPGRDGATMVYDSADSGMLLFGGLGPVDYYNDTWLYTGGAWSQVTTSGAPEGRSGPGMAYDPDLSKVVVYGGSPTGDALTTYTYADGIWTGYNLAITPPQTTTWGQMTYDYTDHYLVLFDKDPYDDSNSTWKLNLTSGISPPPLTVTPTAVPQTGAAPLQVAFGSEISGGTPPYTVTWSFGDSTPDDTGSPMAAGNTSHTYESAGAYGATLTVVDSADAMFTKDWTITATATALALQIGANPTSAKVNQTVTFTSTPTGGTPPYTYAWSFGDGGMASSRNATHGYATTGKFEVRLMVDDHAGGSISKTVNVTVSTSSPAASSTASDWWIYLIVAIVIVIAIVIVVWYRRRKAQHPPPPGPPNPPSGQPGGGSRD